MSIGYLSQNGMNKVYSQFVSSDPNLNQCVKHGTGGLPVCGDTKCELNEKSTCTLDCGGNNNNLFNIDPVLIFIILAFVVIIVVMIIIKMRMSKGQSGSSGGVFRP